MSNLYLKSVSGRTATCLLTPPGTRYHLDDTVRWTLTALGDNDISRSGETRIAPLFLEDLSPATDYRLETAFGDLTFTTPACAGLIRAEDFGLAETADDNSEALCRALAAVPTGGTLVLPRGTFITRPLFLRSQITLYLPEGCHLKAPSTRANWPILPPEDESGRALGTWEGVPDHAYAALLTAIDCHDLTITGKGIVDGSGAEGDWWSWPKDTREGARRARTIFLAHCRGVTLSGLTVTNSPSWTIHPFQSKQISACALAIINPPDSPNTDGLNPESCEDVDLTGLHFSVGDDCIAVKAGKRDGARIGHLAQTRSLAIRHCLMERGHGAVVLGSEMSGDIRDVEIEACEFSQTDRGLRIKTRRGRGGVVENIRLSNVVMDRVDTALAVNAFYFCDADGRSQAVQSRAPAAIDDTTPTIRNIALTGVVATNVRLAAIAVLGLPEAPVTGLIIDSMTVTFDPAAKADVPLMADRVAAIRHCWLLWEYADGDTSGLRVETALSSTKGEAPAC